MNNKPIKKDESLFGGGLLALILRQTFFCTVVTLIGFYIGAFMEVSETFLPSDKIGQTMAFLICGWTSIIHIFNVRTSKSVFKASIGNNKPLLISAAAMIIVFGLMAAFPFGEIFGLTIIGGIHWLAVAGLSLVPTTMREITRLIDTWVHRKP